MILNKVYIKNYRQYKNVEIDFAKDSNKNFTIIQGNNGTGKTTLLNALSWCLYGSEIHDYGDEASMSICNNKTVKLAENGDKIKVSVKIEFIDNDETLTFHRVNGFKKRNNDLIRYQALDKFETITQDGLDYKTKENDFYTIQRKIPREIEDYFFFDGARLSEYFQSTQSNQIKNAVYSLYQLNLLDNLSTNIDKVKSQYIKKQKNILPKLGKAQEDINNLEKDLDKANNDYKKAADKLNEIKSERNKIDSKLIDKKSSDLEKDVMRNKDIEERIQTINNNLNDLENKRKNHILKNYPYVLSYNYFLNFLEKGEESREKGYIPPKYKPNFLRDLLNEGKCICGADLSEGTENRKILTELLDKSNPISDSSEEITSALTQVQQNTLKSIKNFKKIAFDNYKNIHNLEKELEQLIDEKRDIEARLDANPIEEVRKLREYRKQLDKEKDKNERIMSNLKSKIPRLEKELGEKRKLLNNEKKLKIESDEYTKKIDFCDEIADASSKIYSELKENVRKEVQRLTKEKFVKIQWKKDEFTNIEISEDYEVYIVNRLGEKERPGDLSDGEKLCLGLCFMSALHNLSGFDLPIIMDTPLGNLDVDMRHNIAEFLPKFVGDKQTVLLVTGTEYTDDFRDTLYDSIGKEYKIEWNNSDDGKESKVILNE